MPSNSEEHGVYLTNPSRMTNLEVETFASQNSILWERFTRLSA